MPLFFSELSVVFSFMSFLCVLDIVVAHVVVRVILRIGVRVDVCVGVHVGVLVYVRSCIRVLVLLSLDAAILLVIVGDL